MKCWLLILTFAVSSSFAFGESIVVSISVPSNYYVAWYDSTGELIHSKQYDRATEDEVLDAFSTRNGDLIVIGRSDCFMENKGFRIDRLSKSGDVVWSYCGGDKYNTTYLFARGSELKDGTFLICCNNEIFLISDDGEEMWSSKFEGIAVRRVIVTPDGGYALVGTCHKTDEPKVNFGDDDDGVVVKLDSSRVQEWRIELGGDYFDYLYDMCVTDSGSLCAVGESRKVPLGQGGSFGWVIRLTSDGVVLGEEFFSNEPGLLFWDIQNAPDGGFLMLGRTEREKAEELAFMKISETGDSLWYRSKGDGWNHAEPVEAFGQSNFPLGEYINRAVEFETSHMICSQAYQTKEHSPFIQLPDEILKLAWNGPYLGTLPDGFFLAGTYILPKSESDSITAKSK